jgi:hypothetical protein
VYVVKVIPKNASCGLNRYRRFLLLSFCDKTFYCLSSGYRNIKTRFICTKFSFPYIFYSFAVSAIFAYFWIIKYNWNVLEHGVESVIHKTLNSPSFCTYRTVSGIAIYFYEINMAFKCTVRRHTVFTISRIRTKIAITEI